MDVDRRDRSPRRGQGAVKVGDNVIIGGLSNQQVLNGACGEAVSFDDATARLAREHLGAGGERRLGFMRARRARFLLDSTAPRLVGEQLRSGGARR